MALERVLARLALGAGVEPLNSDAALDAAAGVAEVVGHARHGARHEFETGLAALPRLELDIYGGSGSCVSGLWDTSAVGAAGLCERCELLDMHGA